MENSALIHGQQLALNNRNKDKLNLKAYAGNVISIIGPDQDGKADCLKILGDVINAESGQLYLSGKDTRNFEKQDWVDTRTQFAYVHANTAILSAANAQQNLMLPAMYHKTGEATAIINRAQQLLADINAGDNLELLPAYLTKEQRYKIAVARALMLKPKALLLESPFTALELASINQFKQFLLGKVKDDNLLLVLATHDSKFALQHSDQIIYISKQKLLQFDTDHRIQDCNDQEVCDYLSI